EDGREIVTYTGIDDCLEKVEYLLEHDAERGAIANAGRTRTLSQHTVRNRAKVINEVIQEALAANRRAKRQHWSGLPGSLPA
ncbi:MAG: glycosyltransferase family 1 protein, partial [bacterium]|nr:glycosyltransferase family 1 protein [bacterium]